MIRYEIKCTAEQTVRAYKLGAPIHPLGLDNVSHILKEVVEIDGHCYIIPTTEQMCGWIREKGIHVQVMIYGHKSYYCALYKIGSFDDAERTSEVFINTYEQAILAAIDAALDYLEKGGSNGN